MSENKNHHSDNSWIFFWIILLWFVAINFLELWQLFESLFLSISQNNKANQHTSSLPCFNLNNYNIHRPIACMYNTVPFTASYKYKLSHKTNTSACQTKETIFLHLSSGFMCNAICHCSTSTFLPVYSLHYCKVR